MSASTPPRPRPWYLRPGCIGAIVAVIAAIGLGLWIYFSVYQGRDIARFTGIPVKIALPECIKSTEQVLSISFHKETTGETIKDVTYSCDGRIYSHEYNDFGILQGTIEWTYQR